MKYACDVKNSKNVFTKYGLDVSDRASKINVKKIRKFKPGVITAYTVSITRTQINSQRIDMPILYITVSRVACNDFSYIRILFTLCSHYSDKRLKNCSIVFNRVYV